MSSYNILAIRTCEGEPENPLYPEPGERPDTIELASEDGKPVLSDVSELVVRHLVFGGEPQRLARIDKIKAQLFVTDSRVAVACSKYDKGGSATPFGLAAVPLAVGITAVSKVRAARRRRGKMLVGHIHYSRLLSVGFTEWRGIGSHNRLRMTTLDQTVKPARVLALDVTLSKQQSGRELARTIAQLASSYRLGNETDLSDEARQELEALKVAPRLTPEPKSFATYTLISPDDAVVPRPA